VSSKQKINKLWRIFATGLCFSLFGLGALSLTFIVFPLLTLSLKNHKSREAKVQKIIQRCFYLFCETMRITGAIDYKFVGAEKLKNDQNCLIVANHPSLIDYVLITSRLGQCDCLVKEAIWQNPFMKGVVKSAGYIPNKDPEYLLEECSRRLEKGHVILIFPEGTRTTVGKKSLLQRGAAQIAIKTETDLRVVHIRVTPSFLTKEKKWYQVPDSLPFFHIEVQDKIAVAPFLDKERSPAIAVRKLNNYLAEVLLPPQ